MKEPPLHARRRRALAPALILVVFAALYPTFRSVSFDDFDAYSFALALDRFDLALQQPQPPGFPLYIAAGRALCPLSGSALAALTLVSALSGIAASLLLYHLGRDLAGRRSETAGVLAALLAGLTPLAWLTAGKALSDAPGLAATLLALWLLWQGRERPRLFVVGSGVAGLALGVRPQNALPIALLGGYLAVDALLRRKSWHLFAGAGLAFTAGVGLWLAPTALLSGGLDAYLALLRGHAAHVGRADSLAALGLPLGEALRARALAFADTWLTAIAGVSLFAPLDAGAGLRLAALLAVALPGVAAAGWRRRETWIVAAWALIVAGQTFLFVTLDRPRLMLPLLPPLAILVALGWARLRPRWLAGAIAAGASLALLVQGAPLASALAAQPAPPAQAAAYVRERYPAGQTLLATAGSFRAVQVELPGYRQAYLYRFDPEMVQAELEGDVRYVVVFDRDQFTAEALEALSAEGRYVTLEDRTFARDRRVHTQHDQVRLQVLTPAELIPAEALEPPPGGCIDVGGVGDGRYLDAGWFRPEVIAGAEGRWAGGGLTTTLRVALAPGVAHRVQLRALAFPPGQAVTPHAGSWAGEPLPLGQGWGEVEFVLPAEALAPEGVTTLRLVHAAARSPFEATGGGSSDTRPLTAAYDLLCILAER